MDKPRAIFAIDIEARGQGAVSHGIISIGVCIGSATEDNVFHKVRFDMLPRHGQVMEKRAMDEFWSLHKDQLDALIENAKDPAVQIREFRSLLDEWDKTHELYILCDNPGFDFGMINTYLDMYLRFIYQSN